MTPTASVAERVMVTEREVEVGGIVKEEMDGGVESAVAGLGSFRYMIEEYGAIVTLPVCLTPSMSTDGHGRVLVLDEVVAL